MNEYVLGSIRERKLLKELTGFLQTLIHKRAVEVFVGSKKKIFSGKTRFIVKADVANTSSS